MWAWFAKPNAGVPLRLSHSKYTETSRVKGHGIEKSSCMSHSLCCVFAVCDGRLSLCGMFSTQGRQRRPTPARRGCTTCCQRAQRTLTTWDLSPRLPARRYSTTALQRSRFVSICTHTTCTLSLIFSAWMIVYSRVFDHY